MSKRIFIREQIEELLKNKNVAGCSERSITYSKHFKIRAVKLYNECGLTSAEIFKQAGFDRNMIGKDQPKECLKRWNRIYRAKGERGLDIETRGRSGGRPKKPKDTKDTSDTDKIKRLEAEVAYLKAENDFLANLRARRAE